MKLLLHSWLTTDYEKYPIRVAWYPRHDVLSFFFTIHCYSIHQESRRLHRLLQKIFDMLISWQYLTFKWLRHASVLLSISIARDGVRVKIIDLTLQSQSYIWHLQVWMLDSQQEVQPWKALEHLRWWEISGYRQRLVRDIDWVFKFSNTGISQWYIFASVQFNKNSIQLLPFLVVYSLYLTLCYSM